MVDGPGQTNHITCCPVISRHKASALGLPPPPPQVAGAGGSPCVAIFPALSSLL